MRVRRIGKQIAVGFLTLALVVSGSVSFPPFRAKAVVIEDEAVLFSEFSKNHTIENSTIFMGTYLIAMEAMTDELYERAQTSVQDSGQYSVYYKSEIADGDWFDITTAEGLVAITGSSEVADEREMGRLWVTHYVTSDGIIKKAVDDAEANLFDDPSPYDLYRLPELSALRTQYDNNFTEESTGIALYFHDKIAEFYEEEVNNDVTDACDEQLGLLQQVYKNLKSRNKDEQAETVYTLMSKVDAVRRTEVFYQLIEMDGSLLITLQGTLGGENYDGSDPYAPNAELMDAMATCVDNSINAYISYSSDKLDKNGTVLGDREYELCNQILEMAKNGNTDMDAELDELRNLYSIRDSVIKNREEELDMLNRDLIPKAKSNYQKALTQGVSQEYKAAVAAGKKKEYCDKYLELQQAKTEQKERELQFLLQARTERMGDNSQALDEVFDDMEDAQDLYEKIPKDAFQKYAENGLDSYMNDLGDLAKGIIDGDESLNSTLSNLEKDKEEAQIKKKEALDNNDLAGAMKFDAILEAIEEEIAAEQARLQKQMTEGNALDRTMAEIQLGEKTEAANISRIKNKAKERMEDGDTKTVSELAQALAALGATDAMKELLDSLPDGADSELKGVLEDAYKQAKEQAEKGDSTSQKENQGLGLGADEGSGQGGSGQGGTSGSGQGGISGLGSLGLAMGGMDPSMLGKDASKADLLSGLESLVGQQNDSASKDFDSMDSDEKAAALCTASELDKEGYQNAGDLLAELLAKCLKDGNKYIYPVCKGNLTDHFIPAYVVAYATTYRYIYNDNKRNCILSKKGRVYSFTVGSKEALLEDGTVMEMSIAPLMYMGDIYLPEEVCESNFGCRAVYFEGTGYGVCVTEDVDEEIRSMVEAFKGGMK